MDKIRLNAEIQKVKAQAIRIDLVYYIGRGCFDLAEQSAILNDVSIESLRLLATEAVYKQQKPGGDGNIVDKIIERFELTSNRELLRISKLE